MTTLIERLRARTRTDSGDGLCELLEEASREIERLQTQSAELQQQLDAQRPYSSSEWNDDA